MRITPLDVRKQEFRRSVRGFDCDEVRAFMSTLADEYEIVLVDNKQLREKLMTQDDKLTEYQTMERTLRDTLMTAEKLMQETRENASKEGGLIIQDAKLKAKEILQECRLRTEELRREIDGLRKEKEAYLGRFKSLAESQIHFIESHRSDFRELDQRLTTIVDSVAEGMAEQDSHTESETVVDTIVEAMIHPEGAEDMIETAAYGPQPAPAAPAAAPAAPSRQEEDIWRNYNPASPAAAPARPAAEETLQTAPPVVDPTEMPEAAPVDAAGADGFQPHPGQPENIEHHGAPGPETTIDPFEKQPQDQPQDQPRDPGIEQNQEQKADQEEYEPIRF